MFSGIIKKVGLVEQIHEHNGIIDLMVSARNIQQREGSSELTAKLGDSIAINGCCLTITDLRYMTYEKEDEISKSEVEFTFQVTNESLTKTNLRNVQVGSKVNIEPALRMGDKLDGHLVSGHIDDVGEVIDITQSGENIIVKIKHSENLSKYIASKGSICVNGVSLTVIDAKNCIFSFTLIPYTRDNTNLGLIKVQDLVNLEVDLVSRYLVNYMENLNENIKVAI